MDKVLLKYTEYNEPHESRTNSDIVEVSHSAVQLRWQSPCQYGNPVFVGESVWHRLLFMKSEGYIQECILDHVKSVLFFSPNFVLFFPQIDHFFLL